MKKTTMATQATATDSDSVASHMMKLKMKMVQQVGLSFPPPELFF